jgi:hypothetical protein
MRLNTLRRAIGRGLKASHSIKGISFYKTIDQIAPGSNKEANTNASETIWISMIALKTYYRPQCVFRIAGHQLNIIYPFPISPNLANMKSNLKNHFIKCKNWER